MKTLRDLLLRRDELIHGVIEIHENRSANASRSRILWVEMLEEEGVRFTTEKTMVTVGCNWEWKAKPHARDFLCYDPETKMTEGYRPQFDLGGGSWVIIYPNTDSVRIP